MFFYLYPTGCTEGKYVHGNKVVKRAQGKKIGKKEKKNHGWTRMNTDQERQLVSNEEIATNCEEEKWLKKGKAEGKIRNGEKYQKKVRNENARGEKSAGLSQEEAADAADISTVSLSRAERGIYMLNMATMFRLAGAYGVTMSRMCEGM